MLNYIVIHPDDNVAVAMRQIKAGEKLTIGSTELTLTEDVAQGHKAAVRDISAGEKVIKYGFPIGHAVCDIKAGQWVHTHNVKTDLSETAEYVYAPRIAPKKPVEPRTFMGYDRGNGKAGIRNELWIIPTVGCVNGAAQRLAALNAGLAKGGIDGVYAFSHPYGCSQMADDHAQTRRTLAALVKNPNAGGVLVLGLGCENNTMAGFKEELGDWDNRRVKFLVCQDVEDEIEEGSRLLSELADCARSIERVSLPLSMLTVGMKCGGSDGLSGITANPVVGRFTDMLTAMGGTAILTEVPEMFGAEGMLFDRCESRNVFDKAVKMVEDYKDYFARNGQVVYENPSPGNKAGGITTLEDKSLGCVQKGGSAVVTDVIDYAEQVKTRGLNLMSGPGNDLVSSTGMAAAGANLILFTTGRGTPFGSPVPTLKLATNTPMAQIKRGWIDFDAGTVASGESIDDAAQRLLELVIDCASGKPTKAETSGYREIAIFKGGVTL